MSSKNKRWRYWLKRAVNPSYNFWLYLFIPEYIIFKRLSNMDCLEQHYKIIAQAIWFLIIIVTIRYWQEMYYD